MIATRRSFLAGLTMLFLVGFSYSSWADASGATKVLIKDFMFAPLSLTVTAGTTVTWANMDDEPHTIVSDTGAFRSGALDTDESFSFKFATPGTYHFTCSIHPRMVGTIVVK